GAAIQVRLYAEDPARGFQPSAGLLTDVAFPSGVRVETGVDSGSEVSPYYDPLLAKIIARGDTREAARQRLIEALARTRVAGAEDAAALEGTAIGPTLRSRAAATIALSGADMQATLDGRRAPRYQAFEGAAGTVLQLGPVAGPGARAYIAIRGGLDVPLYL